MTTTTPLQGLARWTLRVLAVLVLLVSTFGPGLANAQGTTARNFDHLKTGFALTGEHIKARCESCHVNAVFKGTPRDCASCHTAGMRFARGNVVMSANHLPTQQTCDSCHTTKRFEGTKFNHAAVVAGTCATCHNGSVNTGKPASHIPTQASCDTCHRTTAWSPAANFDHTGVVAGTCNSCHGAGKATGKSATHMPTNAGQSCDSCHKGYSSWRPSAWNHTQMAVAAQCATCHTGGLPPADGKPANHVPYGSIPAAASANCDTCHKGSFATWANGKFHSNVAVTSSCTTCHTGAFQNAVGKPATPVHTGVTNCESCHSTAQWAGAKVDHAAFNASTNCLTCHDGKTATAKPSSHMPIGSTTCFACHNGSPAGWKPTKWTHTQMAVAAQCSTCHTGNFPPADGKPTNHVPYQSIGVSASANCDSCHKGTFTTWTTGRYHPNYSVTSGCATCHTGTFMKAVGKPATTVHNGVTSCEGCHNTTGWAGAKVDHKAFTNATNCATCHDGVTASKKPDTHMPVGATNCFGCHNVSPQLWTPTKFNHTQVTVAGQCASCHTGGFQPADGRSTDHIPYQSVAVSAAANCDSCHKGSFATWANGKYHANYTVSGSCATCHTGAFGQAVGKPNNAVHASVTGNCETCHKSTSVWTGAKVDHSSFTNSTNCASCHSGTTATPKPATHMPVGTTNCIACHNVSPQLWTPTKWNHTQLTVAGQCANCHNGTTPPADGKPSNHMPYATVAVAAAANCDSCHKGSFTSWANGKFHSNYSVTTGCVTCHTTTAGGSYLQVVGKPNNATHAAVTGSCETCHKSTATWAGAKVDHSTYTAATNCVTCHDGKTATPKPALHIPVGAATCFACHNVSPQLWTPTKWNHTQTTVVGQCATCHTGAFPNTDGKPTNHIPYASVAVAASANCDGCHKGSFTTWTNGKFHSNYAVTAGCVTCHTTAAGGSYLQADGKPNDATHAAVTGNCESCHKSTSTWSGAKVDHSTFTAATNCVSCHDGTTATPKPTLHIPVGAATCFACHNVSPQLWTPTKWNHTQTTVVGQCATCHTGAFPNTDGKPTNHIPYASVAVAASANCDGCHKGSFTTWTNGKFHSNYAVTAGCVTCHTTAAGGSYLQADGKPNDATHAAVTGNCESCHKSTSTWSGAKVDHSTFTAATNCVSCHDGTTATPKPTLHIPVGAATCFACHNVSPQLWTPTKWNHTQTTVVGQCATCHTGSFPNTDGKPTNHIPYASVAVAASANCDGCHKGSFTTWTNGKFHSNYAVTAGCVTCHTTATGGSYLQADGKPNNATHASVTGTCETCHKSTTTWLGAKVDHSTFTAATNCVSCHNGTTATPKPTLHIPVGAATCFACHNVSPQLWTPTKWNHTQTTVVGQCATCHTGSFPNTDGKPTNHIPYASVAVAASANCDGCHKGSFTTWTSGKFHTNYTVATGCVTCHSLTAGGSYLSAVGKPNNATHASVTGTCETCHKSTSTWSGAKVDHSTYTAATNCVSCHNGTTATAKPTVHIPVGAATCFACHNVSPQQWTPTKWNHTQTTVVGQCASCHTGAFPNTDGKPTNHIPYASVAVAAAANCDGCHKGSFTTWTNGKFHTNYSVSTGCVTCHSLAAGGSYLSAVGKPANATHAAVTGNCESCHKSTTTWLGAKVDHSTFTAATNCVSCHNGTTATAKPTVHIPVGTATCFACHNVSPQQWTPTKWNHTQTTVVGQCASCHTGAFPNTDGKPTNHIPYASVAVAAAANCDGCHKGSFTTWTNGKFHTNYSVSTGCVTCHTLTPGGSYLNAVGKPTTANHTGVTGSCESCHKSTASWQTVTFAHSPANAVGTGTCDTCHNGTTAKGKDATHIPVPAGVAKCDSCHKSQASFATAVTMNHTVVTTAQCKTCHNGSFTSQGTQGALGKPTNHIPEVQLLNGAAMDCKACHTSTTSFGTMTMNHNASQGNGSGWCIACHRSGTNFLGNMEKKSLTHERSTGVTDCSQSGCHRPLGNEGTAYRNWD